MTRLVELLEACDHGDAVQVERLGWREIIDALRIWPRRLGWDDVKPYAIALGDEDPDQVVAAIRALAGAQYRPSAAEVYIALHRDDGGTEIRELHDRPDITPAALQAVRLAAAAGEPICDCHPRSPMMTMDRDGVLRCPDCGGLEVGQYETAIQSPESAQ